MMNIYDQEECKKQHIIYVYNDLYKKDEASIDNKLVEELYKSLLLLNKYKKINLVLETGGGNLAAGTRLVKTLKSMYEEYEVTVLNRCHSTGTLIAMASSQLNILPKSILTPCEPQIDYNDDNVSISLIRNLIENGLKDKIDIKTLGIYYSYINYFKDLCYQLYDKNKADKIINYMLYKVNSHQYPLSINELLSLDVNVKLIEDLDEINYYLNEDSIIRSELLDIKNDNEIESPLTIIKDRNSTKTLIRKYKNKNNSYKQIYEGYIERR